LLQTCSPEEDGNKSEAIRPATDAQAKTGTLGSARDRRWMIETSLNPDKNCPHRAFIHWTRWKRLGGSTTSNGAKCVLAHLNAMPSDIYTYSSA
jgi:hypothetical protein